MKKREKKKSISRQEERNFLQGLTREEYCQYAANHNRFRFVIGGKRALFTRPENRVDPTSYEVITPSAVRGVMSNIIGKSKQMNWHITKISVLKPIRFESYTVNGLGEYADPLEPGKYQRKTQPRRHTVLVDVSYEIELFFTISQRIHLRDVHGDGNIADDGKYRDFIRRYMANGNRIRFHPHLGTRNMLAEYRLLGGNERYRPINESRDLGIMLWGKDYQDDRQPIFFRAVMENGVIEVPDISRTFKPTVTDKVPA